MEQTGQKQSAIFEVKCSPRHHGVFYRYTQVSCVMGYMVCVPLTYNNLVFVMAWILLKICQFTVLYKMIETIYRTSIMMGRHKEWHNVPRSRGLFCKN